MYEAIQGDCIEVLKDFDDSTFDSVVTDPPYALSFMGKDWDSFGKPSGKAAGSKAAGSDSEPQGKGFQAWCEEWATECLRVLKPGGYLLAFGGTRTYHRETCAIEDAGFEIRDSLHWIYGSGFPKSMDVSKAIDKAAGAERNGTGIFKHGGGLKSGNSVLIGGGLPDQYREVTVPATEAAKAWAGWGTALKPAHEPIVMARKPLSKGHTVAANVLEFGTGGINIDGCRIDTAGEKITPNTRDTSSANEGWVRPWMQDKEKDAKRQELAYTRMQQQGRWPPNVILSDDAAEEMDRQSIGTRAEKPGKTGKNGSNVTVYGREQVGRAGTPAVASYTDSGGASRFFPCFKYQAKASPKQRPVIDGIPAHPTVKPLALMRWLVKLVTPPAGYVLDPFAGTGTTAEACELQGFNSLLIERDPDSIRRIEKRMSKYRG